MARWWAIAVGLFVLVLWQTVIVRIPPGEGGVCFLFDRLYGLSDQDDDKVDRLLVDLKLGEKTEWSKGSLHRLISRRASVRG